MSDNYERRFLFLRKFLTDVGRVAAVMPSSRPLAEALCREVDPDTAQTIVELGAGTGAVTSVACQRSHPQSRIIALEIDLQFAAILRRRCPRAEVVTGDVRDLESHLAERNVTRIDLMICCLALPALPRQANAALLQCLARRGPQACFTQLTLVPLVYRRMYTRLFDDVRFRMVFRNFPPGGAYYCRQLRADYAEQTPGKL